MLKYVQFLHSISGSEARFKSITASLQGTASYVPSASFASNVAINWDSSSFSSSIINPGVTGFDVSGKPFLYSSAQNQARLVYLNGKIQWVLV
jgi:hypothetical protein